MMRSVLLITLMWFAMTSTALAADTEALLYLNQLRLAAGMKPLQQDPHLAQAAQAHADYLRLNHRSGHGESPGLAGFTGRSPSDRALAASYPSSHVSENVHYQQGDIVASEAANIAIDGLMTAIYHRFGFLDFDIDRVGVGYSSDERNSVTVFVMANHGEAQACSAHASGRPHGMFYTRVCADSNKKIPSLQWQQAKQAARQGQPAWVLWPYDGATGVDPAFANESPDPLPDLDISGNPLSININPAYADEIHVIDFTLYDDSGRSLPARLLNQHNDPNHKFNARQVSLFPLQRLQWNSRYQASIDMDVAGKREHITWSFRTRDLGVDTFEVRHDQEVLHLQSSQRNFAIYIPPQGEGPDIIHSFSASYQGLSNLKNRLYDSNTMMMHINQPNAQARIHIQTDSGFQFTIAFDG
jgi:hypothetical protein